MNTDCTSSSYTVRSVQEWGSDSKVMGIDNRCSACMLHNPADFVGDLIKCKRIIKGFGGKHYIVYIGTIKWHKEDN